MVFDRRHTEALGESLSILHTMKSVSDGFVELAAEQTMSEIQVAGFILSYRAVAQFLEDDMNASRSESVKLEAFDGILVDMEAYLTKFVREYLSSRVQTATFKKPVVTDEDDA